MDIEELNLNIEPLEELDISLEATDELNVSIDSEVIAVDSYKQLNNLPSINGVTLIDNKSSSDLGLQPEGEYPEERVTNLEIDNLF